MSEETRISQILTYYGIRNRSIINQSGLFIIVLLFGGVLIYWFVKK